ncbi:MAG: hypothetical protein R6U88_05820 [Candidatus Bipolaricaulota bacterium]
MRKWMAVGTALLVGLVLGTVGYAVDEGVNVSWDSQWFIRLTIDELSVSLGTIGGDDGPGSYDPNSGEWEPLESTGHGGWVLSNNPNGFTLTVSAANEGGYEEADLSRFFITGWTTEGWQALNDTVTLGTRGNAGRQDLDDIGYRYEPSFDDAPGDYEVTVTFTATTE